MQVLRRVYRGSFNFVMSEFVIPDLVSGTDFVIQKNTFGSILATLTFTFNWSLGGSLFFIEGKHSQEINDFCFYWPFCYPIMIPRDQKALAKEAIDPVKYKAYKST